MGIQISMDTETWGKRAGCDARSIGACVFDPVKGINDRKESFYVNLSNPLMGSYSTDHYTQQELDCIGGSHRKYWLHRDPTTVKWWYDQPEEARNAFDNPVDLREGLMVFSRWLASLGFDPKVDNGSAIWTHGGAYDCPVVEAWYHAVRLPVPWHYRSPRDTRSIFDFAGVGNHEDWMKRHSKGIRHHSGDDSFSQAEAICATFALRGSL